MVLLVLTFGYHVKVDADSSFVCSGITYEINADHTVTIVRSLDKEIKLSTIEDSVLIVSSIVSYQGREYKVKGIGKSAFAKWSGLKKVIISNGIESIGEASFQACANLTSVSIPSSVKHIGDRAFSFCINLVSIEVDGDNPFYDSREECNAIIIRENNTLLCGCNLTKIPSSVETIGCYAFCGCAMSNIIIPIGIKTISSYAFSNCHNLESISISSTVDELSWNSFADCNSVKTVRVDDENTTYDSRYNCNAIIDKESNTLVWGCASSKIPDSVIEIGECAFLNCVNLYSIIIPEGVTVIRESAFCGCSGLKYVMFPSSLKSLDGGAQFANCISLDSIHIPQNLEYIQGNVFGGCLSLRKITVDPRNNVYDSRRDCNAVIHTQSNRLVVGCSGSVIDDDIRYIGNMAFYNSGITSIHIPASVESIDSTAFKGCKYCYSISVADENPYYKSEKSNSIVEKKTRKMVLACLSTKILSDVLIIGAHAYLNTPSVMILPEGIEEIGCSAFMGCDNLNTIFIPSSVKHIDEFCFVGCNHLSNVILMGHQTKVDRSAFLGCEKLIVNDVRN